MIYIDKPDLTPMGTDKEQLEYLREYLYKAVELINLSNEKLGDEMLEAVKGMSKEQRAQLLQALNS